MRTISDHILDVVQNSISANATLIEVIVDEDKINDFYTLIIKDNGSGMDAETLQKATSPFFTSRKTRKVGLGLSLLKQNAETASGSFTLQSEIGKGTTVKAQFRISHLDRPPLGDIWETYFLTILANNNVEINYTHSTQNGKFEINSTEIKEIFKEVPLQNNKVKKGITDFIKNNLLEIKASN